MEDDTPEGRLEAFARAIELSDPTIMPSAYQASEDGAPMVADLREVAAKARKYDALP
jgi:hypothetical protein